MVLQLFKKNTLLFVGSLVEELLQLAFDQTIVVSFCKMNGCRHAIWYQQSNIVFPRRGYDFLETWQNIPALAISSFCNATISDHQECQSVRHSVSPLLWSRLKYISNSRTSLNFVQTIMVPRGCILMTLVTFRAIIRSKCSPMLTNIYQMDKPNRHQPQLYVLGQS